MAVPGQLWVPPPDFRPPSFFSMNPQFLKKSKLSLLRLFQPKSSKIAILTHLVTSSRLPWLREAKVDLPCQNMSKCPKMTYFSTFSLFRKVIPTPGQGNLTQMSTLSTPLGSHPTPHFDRWPRPQNTPNWSLLEDGSADWRKPFK